MDSAELIPVVVEKKQFRASIHFRYTKRRPVDTLVLIIMIHKNQRKGLQSEISDAIGLSPREGKHLIVVKVDHAIATYIVAHLETRLCTPP